MISLFKKVFWSVFSLLFILFIWLMLTWFLPVGGKHEYVISVDSGDSSRVVANKLKASGLNYNPQIFSLLTKYKKVDQKIKIGEYKFIGPISMWQVVEQLVKTESTEIKITLIEGWSARQVAGYLENSGLFNQQEFLEYINNPPKELYAKYSFLESGKSLEGYLFPDTYFVYKTVTIEELVDLLLITFERKVGADYVANKEDFYNILKLASIVQDEVSKNNDMGMVADIFQKRLKQGMPLQSDATVNYITGKGMASPLISDTEIQNPYNTYRNKGLPPTPISNPGVQAIKAVLNPLANPYYYFLTTKDGQTIYSKTFAEHVANKNKYLK